MLSVVLTRRVLPTVIAMVVSAAALVIAGRAISAPTGAQKLPDLVQVTPTDLVITRSGSGAAASYVLGFRSAVRNVGDGPLIIEGHRPGEETGTMDAAQVIVRDGARPRAWTRAGSCATWSRPITSTGTASASTATSCAGPVTARAAGQGPQERASASATATRDDAERPPARGTEPVYTSRCGLDRPASASGCARASPSDTATTMARTSRASTCGSTDCPPGATCSSIGSTRTPPPRALLRQQRRVGPARLRWRHGAPRSDPGGAPEHRTMHARTLKAAAAVLLASLTTRRPPPAPRRAPRPSPPASRSRGRSRSCPTAGRSSPSARGASAAGADGRLRARAGRRVP